MKTKRIFYPIIVDGIPEITPEVFGKYRSTITLIDVRRADEFNGELSHIAGAKLVTLGPDLDSFLSSHDKDDEIVFVCRSGRTKISHSSHEIRRTRNGT